MVIERVSAPIVISKTKDVQEQSIRLCDSSSAVSSSHLRNFRRRVLFSFIDEKFVQEQSKKNVPRHHEVIIGG